VRAGPFGELPGVSTINDHFFLMSFFPQLLSIFDERLCSEKLTSCSIPLTFYISEKEEKLVEFAAKNLFLI
jgi:hypothetical protein